MKLAGSEMLGSKRAWVLALPVAATALAGCSDGLAGGLRSAGVVTTPDEFLVLPTRPLELPEDFATLPPPTPGRPNRVDVSPQEEAVAGLTGGEAEPAGTVSGAALAARVGPADPQIRARLAVEDATFRQENRGRVLERVFAGGSGEAFVYRDMVLDAPAEFERLRGLGLRVPPAPPRVLNGE